ncbi:MAG: hypothetical protein F9K38_12460 [Pseudorhodoplanes sp.]|nr:MAG: hypothetical protein F9K38_12460 [Pseudorhodoplanes sp.]
MRKPEHWLDLIAAAAIAAVALIFAFTFRDYGLGWDDYTHSQYGQLLLDYYRSGFTDRRALHFVNLFMYGGGFDMLAAVLDRATPFDLFETRRLLGAIVGILGLTVLWRLARHVGGATTGLIALLLLATCPLYYGHSIINPKDGPFAAAMVALLFGLVLAIEGYPRPSKTAVLVFGLGLGFSIGSRIMGGLAALCMVVPMLMLLWADLREGGLRHAARQLGRFVLTLLPGVVLAYAIIALVWPWAVQDPLNLFRAVGYFSHFFEKPWAEMYEGAVIPVPDMPRSYVPVLFALKLPEIFLLLAGAGIVGASVAACRPDFAVRRRAALTLILFMALLPIAAAVITRPAMYNGIRHFVFVVPPLALLGGLAGGWIVAALGGIADRKAQVAGLAMLSGLLLPVSDMVRIHPYQYANFNRFAGGIYDADDKFMVDYWGLAFKEAAQKLRTKLIEDLEIPVKGRRWRVAVCGPHASAEVELGPEFVTTWDPRGADFAMMLGTFYCADYDAPVLIEVEREDVILARVYDIRGRTYTSVFAPHPGKP